MDWLGEILFAISFLIWVALAELYARLRLVRDSFMVDEVGQQLASILTALFGFVVTLASLSLLRLALTVDSVEDPVTTVFRILGAIVYGSIVVWTVRALRGIRAAAKLPPELTEYDPYGEPFGER